MATITAKPGWSYNAKVAQKMYTVADAANIAEVITLAKSTAGATWEGLIRDEIGVETREVGRDVTGSRVWDVIVNFKAPDTTLGALGYPITIVTFDMQPITLTKFRTPIDDITAFGDGAAEDYKGLIGVNDDGTVTGSQVEASQLVVDVEFNKLSSEVDSTYIGKLVDLSNPNHVNDADFTIDKGTSANSIPIVFGARRLRFRGAKTRPVDQTYTAITLSFVYGSPVDEAFDYSSGSTTLTADPHDIIWYPTTNDHLISGADKTLIRLPKAAYVHKIYPDANFDDLEIPT